MSVPDNGGDSAQGSIGAVRLMTPGGDTGFCPASSKTEFATQNGWGYPHPCAKVTLPMSFHVHVQRDMHDTLLP